MKPEERVLAYLNANRTGLQVSTLNKTIGLVKSIVFYGMSPLSDDELRKIIGQWAMIYCVQMLIGPQAAGGNAPAGQTPGPPPPANSSEMLDSVKKAMSVVIDGVTLGSDKTNVVIKVSGATANLKRGDQSASLSISWGGTLDLKAQSGPFNFAGTLAKDKWEISLTFPRDSSIPDMSRLGKVFSEGEKSVRNMAAEASKFKNIQDASTISALVKQDIKNVQEAADSLSSISDHPKGGGISFGFKIGSPDAKPGEEGIPKGYQGTIVFTYTF